MSEELKIVEVEVKVVSLVVVNLVCVVAKIVANPVVGAGVVIIVEEDVVVAVVVVDSAVEPAESEINALCICTNDKS